MLLDLHLPKQHGTTILRAIRQQPDLSHVQVLVVTSAASPREEAELRALGAECRLKPGSLAEFDALAAELIAICEGMTVATF